MKKSEILQVEATHNKSLLDDLMKILEREIGELADELRGPRNLSVEAKLTLINQHLDGPIRLLRRDASTQYEALKQLEKTIRDAQNIERHNRDSFADCT